MEIFGELWVNYHDRIKQAWLDNVKRDDVVCIAGDISQALNLNQACTDIQWLDALPGHKILLKGNHDSWWSSISKMKTSFSSR